MTDLFTVYNLPLQVSSFFEHFRSGDMPIGIASMDLYLQLKYAAPELAGQWDVAPIPGIVNPESGRVERYASSYGKTAILFSNSEMKAEGWDLIRWWTSAETQTKYHQIVKTSLGERYLQIPANMVALQNLRVGRIDQGPHRQSSAVGPDAGGYAGQLHRRARNLEHLEQGRHRPRKRDGRNQRSDSAHHPRTQSEVLRIWLSNERHAKRQGLSRADAKQHTHMAAGRRVRT
ncbi:MAG: hypothetical protein MZU97_20065 [Bacillus subtilis]|nr:hypothetical protein [Bacillus subtilis]